MTQPAGNPTVTGKALREKTGRRDTLVIQDGEAVEVLPTGQLLVRVKDGAHVYSRLTAGELEALGVVLPAPEPASAP